MDGSKPTPVHSKPGSKTPLLDELMYAQRVPQQPEPLVEPVSRLVRAPDHPVDHNTDRGDQHGQTRASTFPITSGHETIDLSDQVIDLSDHVIKTEEHCVGCGRFGDVYIGRLVDLPVSSSERKVAIKVVRSATAHKEIIRKLTKRLKREIFVWQCLAHDNILPFLGISNRFGNLPALISPWMENGQLDVYLDAHPEVDRKRIAHGIARGLLYLHTREPQITHGDIKTANTLIDREGNPRLSDFGLSRMLCEDILWMTTTVNARGSLRWMAPELIFGSEILPTLETDVYAFAMTVLEIITGKWPYHKYFVDPAVIAALDRNELPDRPSQLNGDNWTSRHDGDVWTCLISCWNRDPEIRPTMEDIEELFQKSNGSSPAPTMIGQIAGLPMPQLQGQSIPSHQQLPPYPQFASYSPFVSGRPRSGGGPGQQQQTRRSLQVASHMPNVRPDQPTSNGSTLALRRMGLETMYRGIRSSSPPPVNQVPMQSLPGQPHVMHNPQMLTGGYPAPYQYSGMGMNAYLEQQGWAIPPQLPFPSPQHASYLQPTQSPHPPYLPIHPPPESPLSRAESPPLSVPSRSTLTPPSSSSQGTQNMTGAPTIAARPRVAIVIKDSSGKVIDLGRAGNKQDTSASGGDGGGATPHLSASLTPERKGLSVVHMESENDKKSATDGTHARHWHTVRAVDESSPESVDINVRRLLDQLSSEDFDLVSDQIIDWANKSENETNGRTLMQVIRLVFEKATNETCSGLCAHLCRKMLEKTSAGVVDESIKTNDGRPFAGGQLFRKYLLNRCQEDFERGWAAAAKADNNTRANAAEQNGEEALYSEEYYVAQKAKRQGLGLVKFIGELFKLQMLTERIMHECIKKFLRNVDNPTEEGIESLCMLLETVGERLDIAKAQKHMDVYFTRMKELAQSPKIASRLQYMLQDIIELRDRKWRARTEIAAPRTIDHVYSRALDLLGR